MKNEELISELLEEAKKAMWDVLIADGITTQEELMLSKSSKDMQEELRKIIQKALVTGRNGAIEISKLKQAEKVYVEEGVKNRTEIEELKQQLAEKDKEIEKQKWIIWQIENNVQ